MIDRRIFFMRTKIYRRVTAPQSTTNDTELFHLLEIFFKSVSQSLLFLKVTIVKDVISSDWYQND